MILCPLLVDSEPENVSKIMKKQDISDEEYDVVPPQYILQYREST